MNTTVSIIIANYNGISYISDCLKSVLKSTYPILEIIIVDDGSIDQSLAVIERFQREDSRIVVLRNERNLGAAASRNKALQDVKGDIIVFLDNDTEVKSDWLGELIKPFLKDPNIGAAQAMILDFHKRNFIQMAGGLLIPYTGWLLPFNQGERYSVAKFAKIQREIVAISAALAVKREVIKKVGCFDDKEAVYTEDLDFCWRIWLAGYKIVLSSKSVVYHYTKTVSNRAHMKGSKLQIYYHMSKNSFRSIIKNYELFKVVKFLPASIFIHIIRGLFVLFKRRDLTALMGMFYGIIWNIFYFSNTLKYRRDVQRTRQSSDEMIFKRAFIENNLLSLYHNHLKKSKLLW